MDHSNPPPPAGTRPLHDSEVTHAMSAWAVAVLTSFRTGGAPPMFGYELQDFGGKTYLAWVNWHPPDFQNGSWHSGVTLFEVVDASALPTQPGQSSSGDSVEGIDVSHNSGAIDWSVVASQGITFAALKASEGLPGKYHTPDVNFQTYAAGARAAGLTIGAYHFYRPELGAVSQAQHFLEVIAGFADGDCDMEPALDVEVTDGMYLADVVMNAKIFCDYVAENIPNGKRPDIYTSAGFWPKGMPMPDDLWVASWRPKSPILQPEWSWKIWQYAGDVTMRGVAGKVDRDRFAGDLAAFKQWIGVAA